MANYIATDTDLTAVADAIRAKASVTNSLVFPSGWISAIGGITGGGSGSATGGASGSEVKTYAISYGSSSMVFGFYYDYAEQVYESEES